MKLRTWCIRSGQILAKPVLVFAGFLVFLTIFNPATIQAEDGRGTITIRHENVPIQKVFQSIEKQSGYRFFYNETLLQGAVKVTLHLQNVSLQEALDACFRNQPLSYAIVDKTIIVKRRPEQQSVAPIPAAVSFSAPKKGKLIAVRGKVTSNNIPVVGASIMIKGTDNGASTDKDGIFTLAEVDEEATLVVSSVSHQAREVRLNGQSFIAIDLSQKSDDLDEAMVVAYNTTTKRMNTGAVTVVKGEEFQSLPNRSVDKSLQGLVPGLLVTSGTGQPGGGLSNFVLRGIATGDDGLSGSSLRNPLIVIDGVPVSQDPQQLRINGLTDVPVNNPMAQINPYEIESISVLKDAAAIALYGSKASNGVILITTKRGKTGKTIFNLRQQTDISTRLKGKIDLLNQDEYMELLIETYKNTYPTATTDSIMGILKVLFPLRQDGSFYPFEDLADKVYNNAALTFSNDLSISGGNGRSSYFLNLEWSKQNGTYRKTGYDRKSIRFNFDNKVTDWLKIGMNNGLSYNKQDYSMVEGSYTFGTTNLAAPLTPVYLENGDYLLNYSIPYQTANPIAAMEYNFSTNTSYRSINKLFAEVSILKGLKLSTSAGIDFQLTEAKEKRDPRLYDPKTKTTGSGRIEEGEFRNANLITTNIISFDKLIHRDHFINALIGQEAQVLTQKNVTAVGTGLNFYTNDQINNTATRNSSGFTSKQTLLSYFGQLNYDFKKKYFLSSSLRLDASSKFGSNQRFGSYWSAGGGWIMSNEPFMNFSKSWLSYFKIRSSIGMAGNSGAINKYTKYTQLATSNYQNASTIAVYPIYPNNPEIKWEETFTWDAGLEAKLWNGRIGFTADIYQRKTSNLIYLSDLPLVSGFSTTYGNIGDMQNKGIEISLTASVIKSKDFRWDININWSTNKNILVKSNVPFVKVTGGMLANEEGRNFNSYYLPVWAGVDPVTGLGQWVDSTGKLNSDYKAALPQFVGKPQPDGFGTITNTFTFRGIQLSAQFYYQYHYQIYINPDFENDGNRPFANQTKSALDRWQKTNDVASNPKRTLNNANGPQLSTRRLFDGDHIRLQNVMLAYSLPNNLIKNLHISSIKIYAQANNIAVWTKAQGPDVSDASVQGQTGFGYPNQRTFSFGVNLNF